MILLLLCSDWWLPSVLPTVLRHWDVRVASVSRFERGHWDLLELRYEADGVVVHADAIRVPSVWRYLRTYWQAGVAASLLVEVRQLTVEFCPAVDSSPADTDAVVGVVDVLSAVRSALSAYAAWLPAFEIDTASIRSEQLPVLTLHELSLRGWQLALALESRHLPATVRVRADIHPLELWRVRLNADAMQLQLDAECSFENADGVQLGLTARHDEEVLQAQGVLWRGEWMPRELLVQSAEFSIHSSWFSGLDRLGVERLHVMDLDLSWGPDAYHGRFALTADLPVEPGQTLALQARVGVSGDTDVLKIETCELSGTWGQLTLSNPLQVDLRTRSVLQGAEWAACLDLSKQPWIPAQGQLNGLITLVPDHVQGLDLRFDLRGEHLSYGAYQADGVSLAGKVQGSTITVEHLQLDLLEATEADRVLVSGVADWAERSMDLNYCAALGSDWLNAQLGDDYFADELTLSGRVFGDFNRPKLEGMLEPVTLLHPLLHPVTVEAEVRSFSEGSIDLDLSATCQGAAIAVDVAATHRNGLYSAHFQDVVIADAELPMIRLLEPACVTYRSEVALEDRLQIEPFYLAGTDSAVQVTWGSEQGGSLFIRNMASTRLDHWFKQAFPLHRIDLLDVALTQLQPKILGRVEVHAQAAVADGDVLAVDMVSRIEREGIIIDQLAVEFARKPLLDGTLALPIRLQLPQTEAALWTAIPGGHLSADLTGQTSARFSRWLTELSGVGLEKASLALGLSGCWTDPRGVVEVHVAELNLGDCVPDLEVPVLTELALAARIGMDVCALEQFECRLNESQVAGTASLPTVEIVQVATAWPGQAVALETLVEHLSAQIELTDWKFASWAHFFPSEMRQSGELDGSLILQPGLDLSGQLVLDGFALRPTQAYSTIDQIGAELELSDHKLSVKQASARVGGSPVSLTGWIDGADLSEPLWEFALQGERVPLVRTTDLIVRSDVDLMLQRLSVDTVPKLSGALNFTQSTLLVEFDPLAPSVEGGPSRQPPYFSIMSPLTADWEFDLVATGDAFLRVRSPYFRALISANLTLGGTFLKPRLVGSLRVASGDILFPGVRMELESGEAFIEPTQPNEVQLDFSGIAQLSSYVITMEVSQTVSDPGVYFSSTPTLPSSEIVRLLATGGRSGGEVGAVGVYLGKGLLGVGAGGIDSSLADRLTIDVGEAGGRDGGNTFGVRYRITDRLYLNGGYDIHEAYNLNLLWSVFKR